MAYFDSDGVQIYFEEHGSGEPVVLVHGFASRAEHNWGLTGWYTALSPHYRVVALDCRGHGKSGKPHEASAYAGKIMGGDVIRLMDHLGIRRALLMGYSMGARISLDLLRAHPDRFRAIVLGGIGATSNGAPPFDRKPIVKALLANSADDIASATAKQFRTFAEGVGNDLKALAACMGANRPDQTSEDLKALRVKVPVMIVIGTKDTLVGNPQLLRDSIPGSELVMIESRDHLNAPGDKRYKEAVMRFFEAAPA